MSTLEDPSKLSILLVEFRVGDQGSVNVFSVWLSDSMEPLNMTIPVDTSTNFRSFTTVPDAALSLDPTSRTGNMNEETLQVYTSSDFELVDRASQGRAFPSVTVNVFELLIDSLSSDLNLGSLLYWGSGRAHAIETSPGDEYGKTLWTVREMKGETDSTISAFATEKCINEFGSGKVCKFYLPLAFEQGTLDFADGLLVTINGLSDKPTRWWEDGKVVYRGLSIRIAQWISGNQFILGKLPPLGWLQTIPLPVQVFPGCNQLPTDCATFDQEENFLGLGLAMPRNHPQWEKPDDN